MNSVWENIIEKLEEMIHPKQLYFCKYARGGCKHLDNDDKDCMECVVENAIEIVKQGVVSDDVCEWRIVDRPNNLPIYNTSCGKIRLQYVTRVDIYCNGCGKKIKVVE